MQTELTEPKTITFYPSDIKMAMEKAKKHLKSKPLHQQTLAEALRYCIRNVKQS